MELDGSVLSFFPEHLSAARGGTPPTNREARVGADLFQQAGEQVQADRQVPPDSCVLSQGGVCRRDRAARPDQLEELAMIQRLQEVADRAEEDLAGLAG
jgi:hypothetical protein